MDLQFSVEVSSKSITKELHFSEYNKLEHLDEENIPGFKEQNHLEIILKSSKENIKLFLPDLDDYPLEEQLTDKRGNNFFLSNKSVILYKNKVQDIPLIPGFYLVQVQKEDKKYYSWFKIIPKDLSIEEWKQMKSEIEVMVKGLTIDYKQRLTDDKINRVINDKKVIDLNKIKELVDDIPKITLALNSLNKNAKFNIYKQYSWNSIGDKNQIDQITIRNRSLHPEKLDFLYSHTKKLNYNTDENRWIKFILTHFMKYSMEILLYLDSILENLNIHYLNEKKYMPFRSDKEQEYFEKNSQQKKINIKTMYKKVKQFHAFIYNYINNSWMLEVKNKRPNNVPKTLILNAQYNNIYKTYLKTIKVNEEKFQMDQQFQYFWKRTDYLYEVWTYIKTVKLLQERNYIPVDGWIYEEKSSYNYVPFLNDGTRVIFIKNNQKLALVFNEKLHSRAAKNTIINPLSTSSRRNKPDIRIDIFNLQNDYMGGIIIETKYKPLANIYLMSGEMQDNKNSCNLIEMILFQLLLI